MSDQFVVLPISQLEELVKSSLRSELATFFDKEKSDSQEEKPIIYRTREYVKNLLHTTYPTIQKYSKQGLLKPIYFGRRVLYKEDDLNLAIPNIKTLLAGNKKKTA